jgi:spermidine/putrescine transport system permease protein
VAIREREPKLLAPLAGEHKKRFNWTPMAYLWSPTGVLLLFFAGPLLILAYFAFGERTRSGTGAFTLDNFASLSEPFYRNIALDTLFIAVIAMAVVFLIAYPLAYFIAFRARGWEIPLLLILALSDELNPLVRIFAWKVVLGREGVINTFLQWIGAIDEPLAWLLFTKFSVITVLSAGWIAYAVLPIYGAMKTIDPDVLEGAQDLGAGWFTTWRKILLPLTATGFLATIIIVFIPILSDFAAPALVGGTEGVMLSSVIEEEYLTRGDWGVGSALTFALLLGSAGIVWLSYRISHVKRLQTARD